MGDKKIVFPIEDSLLSLYPEIASSKNHEASEIQMNLIKPLPDYFCK